MEHYLWVLKDVERDVIRETQPARLAKLDEDGLADLHKRVRRARNKHTKNYRRAAAGNVKKAGGRGAARRASDTAQARAYVFEDALARVSAALASAAQEQADLLRDERLARARAHKGKGAGAHNEPGAGKKAGKGKKAKKKSRRAEVRETAAGHAPAPKDSPQNKKRRAALAADGARTQAARDAR